VNFCHPTHFFFGFEKKEKKRESRFQIRPGGNRFGGKTRVEIAHFHRLCVADENDSQNVRLDLPSRKKLRILTKHASLFAGIGSK
jgi:hypothetical protein